MVCQRCKAENPDTNKFCGSCGAELSAATTAVVPDAVPATESPLVAIPVPGDPGAFYCAKHNKAVTRLRCGRCENPICPKCTVYTPGGTRCRTCARHKIAVRPLGVLNEAGRVIDSVATSRSGNRVWYLALWYFIISLFRGLGE